MIFRFLPFVAALRRIAAGLRGCQHELKRIADTIELQQQPRGVSLRTFYRDDRPKGVDDASLLMQDDADFARLERLEKERERRGGAVAMDDDLEEHERG